jgi:MFS family permease
MCLLAPPLPPFLLHLQVPSNLILLRVGARLWLAILLVGWGAVATCMMFVRGVASFYVLRVLLGAFEAGAFPGIWYHLALFIPAHR